jgi:hypothetical protein
MNHADLHTPCNTADTRRFGIELRPMFRFRFLRYGENSGDSMHAVPHFGTSCHYQIFF